MDQTEPYFLHDYSASLFLMGTTVFRTALRIHFRLTLHPGNSVAQILWIRMIRCPSSPVIQLLKNFLYFIKEEYS